MGYGQRWYHAPDEASVKEHHDEGDDNEHAVATDEAAGNQEQVEAIYKGARSDMCGTWVADAPSEQPAAQISDEHHAVGEAGITVV